MEEVSKVRLVRCPKCENLLPELPDFSVYQCGGCGAVLRAKNRGILEDRVLETSDEERDRRLSAKQDVTVGLSSVSEAVMENNGTDPDRNFKRNNNENAVLNGSSSSGVESKGFLEDVDGSRRGRERLGLGFDQVKKIRFKQEGHQPSSNVPTDNRIRANSNCELKSNRPECVKLNSENELEEVRPSVGSLRLRASGDQRGMDRNSSIASGVNPTSIAEQGRFVNFLHPDTGSSNYVRGSHYRYGEQMSYGDSSDGLARVKSLENDRAELLRKLDALADQLTKSCDAAEKPRERIRQDSHIPPLRPHTYDRHDSFMQGGTRFSCGVNNQPLAHDKHVSRAPYTTHSHGFGLYTDRYGFQEAYPPSRFAHEYGGFADVYQSQMRRRPSYQPPNRYQQESYYGHLSGHHMNFNQDLFMSHPHETFFHQPACSCFHCANMNRQVSSKIKPSNMSSQNAHHEYTNSNMYRHVNPLTYDHQRFVSEDSNLPRPKSRDSKAVRRSSSDLDRESAGFGYSRLKNVVVANGGRRLCHPIAGGAPFVTCCNCFELLKLPRNLKLTLKTQRKLKCGGCSSILLFELDGKGLAISVPAKREQVSMKVATAASDMRDENFQSSQAYQDTGVTSNYDAYENFNYNFQLADPEPSLSSGDQKFNFGESEMRQDPNSSTSSSSVDEQSPDSVIVRKEACSAEVSKDEVSLPLPDSPSLEYPDRSSDEVLHKCGQGNKSKRIDQDMNNQDVKTSWHNSLEDSAMATEMDVSYNDHLGVDSAETGKEEHLPRINKGSDSFFVGLIKRGFGDFSRSSKSTESGRLNVSVNGLSIPDRVVKKAEKLSGPIQSGEYWYDFRAGFWGVMGHPCLGIIPPNIEEFSSPMPANCARGNTDVFVNGRELHQKDLDLLASRGLPTTRHKSYLIEVSGRTVDEDTGEELDGLGKLAPTVERAKHGFGMKVPKALLQQER